jgi:signal transduction histidine kinase
MALDFVKQIFHWFSGGSVQYHDLQHCMMGDRFWIMATVLLDLAVAAGYIMIAYHWWQNQKRLPTGLAKSALANMRNIFVFCGICGYLFIPIKMFWPAWRLYDFFLVILVFFTWRYAMGTRQLKVIYSELGRSSQLAEDLRKSQEESRKKGFFLNAVSHDLRTPLNALSLQAGLMELQLQSGGDLEAVRRAADEIQSNARAAAELLDQLLEYARVNEAPDGNTMASVRLAELVAKCAAGFQSHAAAKGIYLRVECPEVAVETDGAKLDRIVRNLLSNAIKFTQQGGITITVEATRVHAEIRITDTGIGIAPEHQEHLFHDFYQVSNAERDRQKGFGLGLAIARQLARQLGGEITCQSSAGKGSCFCVELPLAGGSGGAAVRKALEPAAVLVQ